MKYTYSTHHNVVAITNPDGKNCVYLLGQNLGENKGLELGVAITGLLNGDLVCTAKEIGKESKPNIGLDIKCVGANCGVEMIEQLKALDGAIDYDGNYSVQVAFKLSNGRTLRFVVGDESECLRVDQYPGLAIIGGDKLST